MKKTVQNLPEKASVDGISEKIITKWDEEKVYSFDKSSQKPVFSIDTPPPTVSGSLHVGHVFSYTHTDLIARYKRMQGFSIFYPMGFDDNGLPTERRVQNYYGVRPDLTKPYVENYIPPFEGTDGKDIKASDQQPISRENFVELCVKLSTEDEVKFKELWTNLGVSVDWEQTYQTIGEKARRIAQKAFLRNLKRGEAYQVEAPGLWDITFQTAVAQAELEAREYPGFYHKLAFRETEDLNSKQVIIETTRPELLAACVALIAHPDDSRYKHLFGKTVFSPAFDVEVPVLAHKAAEMDKGAGIAMCCTFGDLTDVQWWRELNLPLRSLIAKNGRLQTVEEVDGEEKVKEWILTERGIALMKEINGKTTFSAREMIVEALKQSGELIGEPEKTLRMTNFFEKGDKPLEIVTSKQWYLKNGGKDESLQKTLLERGNSLNFFPDFMRVRYSNWVNGLNNDWLISRQRFFGVAFPIWFRLDENGLPLHDQILTADEAKLPVDPTTDCPDGFSEDQRDVPLGFTAEKDVMDTWATSSLTPQIACGWEEKEDGDKVSQSDFKNLFPMSIRPQGQDIIRTWLFSTVVRANAEENSLPWENALISGWILDPDRKKMSKSKGNVVTPMSFIDEYGADALRYWSASARLGADATFDEGVIKNGRRLAMKLLNASKFALGIIRDSGGELELDSSFVTEKVDISLLGLLNQTIKDATDSFEKFDHARALELIETFFWDFCDDYIELVKSRAYSGNKSAVTTLSIALDNLIRLLSPFLAFAAEEAWSWFNESSVHAATWPKPVDKINAETENVFEAAKVALIELRKVKSEAKVSQKTPLKNVQIKAGEAQIIALKAAENDLKAISNIEGEINFETADEFMLSAQIVEVSE